jgi:hypothetical protein
MDAASLAALDTDSLDRIAVKPPVEAELRFESKSLLAPLIRYEIALA